MSLYDDLGVSKDATQDEIRKAYRKKAMKLHPDVGGDPDEFKKVSHALTVLSDPDRRDRYDKTGKEDTSNPADYEMTQALEQVALQFTRMLGSAEFHPELHDPIKAARRLLKLEKKGVKAELDEIEATCKRTKKVLARMQRKGKAKTAHVESIVANLERDLGGARLKAEQQLRIFNKAIELLDDYNYTVDEAPKSAAPHPGPADLTAAAAMAALREEILKKYGGGLGR